MGIYGIHTPKKLKLNKISRVSKRLKLAPEDCFILKETYFSYLSSLKKLDTLNNHKNQIKNHSQPLQALYYNRNGNLKSFQINCYAGGFPNLRWDRDSILTTFPPKLQAPIDSIISDTVLLSYLISQSSKSRKIDPRKNDYLVFVFWSKFMGRQNRRFIHFIQQNRSQAEDMNIRIVFVNMDNAFKESNIW